MKASLFSKALVPCAVPRAVRATRTASKSRVSRFQVRADSRFDENFPSRVIVPLPEGATQPTREPEVPPAWFGFVDNAERLNSRFAMIGFFGILIVEASSGKGILELLGVAVGSGLGFEF
ncbi:hypothetical protein BSKO_07652 [Bryopsis sp. KO-2023]|nr:hypothetical protein BSKO_07652 [Bryopsis sp. KO-2023]